MSEQAVEQPADAWGQPISDERQVWLQNYLDRWAAETDHGERKGPFDKPPGEYIGVQLNGADAYWLADQSGRDTVDGVPNLHLEGADLRAAHLEGANLLKAHLERARLAEAHLEDAILSWAHLKGAVLHEAHLEHARLGAAHLKGAYLQGAHLKGADLFRAHLEGADLEEAHLEYANLEETHLEGTNLLKAHLEHANLTRAWMDKATSLNNALLDRASLDQVSFDSTNLAVVTWDAVTMLGDEVDARARKYADSTRKRRQERLVDFEAAVRAHLQLAAQLRAQGMSAQADRFAYRAQILQRARYRLQRSYGQWLFSWLLFLLAGYGYRPGRTLFWYVATIASFAAAFYLLGPVQGHVFQPDGALVFSVTSFHGRGFFPVSLNLEDTVTKLAALEAVIGLFIEISFIATFTQRYFDLR